MGGAQSYSLPLQTSELDPPYHDKKGVAHYKINANLTLFIDVVLQADAAT